LSNHRVDEGHPLDKSAAVPRAKALLLSLLQERVASGQLNKLDARILILRLGLEGERCHSLYETASLIHKSAETVRHHQYQSLRHLTKDQYFDQVLREYARLVPLPRGITYYLHKS